MNLFLRNSGCPVQYCPDNPQKLGFGSANDLYEFCISTDVRSMITKVFGGIGIV